MDENDTLTAEVVEEMLLTADELARACSVTNEWVALHVRAGALTCADEAMPEWRFTGRDIWRARHIHALERDFDAVPELAALVTDLVEELHALRERLRRARL